MNANKDEIDISTVVPVYEEQNSILPFLNRLEPVLEKISPRYEILFILDPSKDQTYEMIEKEIHRNPRIKLIVLSRRFGQPAATSAGLALSSGKYCVTLDVDLQDPPELIVDMLDKIKSGYDVVYAKRRTRSGETKLKKWIAYLGYRIINRLSDISIPNDAGDFRIMTRRVVNQLKLMEETHTYLRGMVAYVGFKQTAIYYDRDIRTQDKSKYNPFFGSLKIGVDGLVNFGSAPLRLAFVIGAAVILFSLLHGIILLFQSPSRFSMLVWIVIFLFGIQLTFIGILGEYIGRIYDDTRKRQRYIIDHIIDQSDKLSL